MTVQIEHEARRRARLPGRDGWICERLPTVRLTDVQTIGWVLRAIQANRSTVRASS